ncbi:DEAD/DEAH box helicase family protein [bacterium]|nr:DEAD/DEAH box helicase family protein [bacterium]MDB4128740.1 DEAD/DEAH box helicase family protein [bacterium]MDC1257225.1 DEAD/DEAH box helicase family protein [bacterium]
MTCKIILKDEVNCKIEGLDLDTRRKCEKELKFFMPHAYHVPAYKLGRWDGCASYFSVGGVTYTNLLDRVLPIIINQGYTPEIEDMRSHHDLAFEKVTLETFQHKVWPEKHPVAGQPVTLRDYQIEIVNKFLETPHCLQEIATGAGKTLITAALSYKVESYGRSIVIVPNKDLVRQTAADYTNLGLDVGVYYGDKKDIGKTHTICTWQSLNSIKKRFREGESELGLAEFAEDVVCVIVDEVHQAKADVLKEMLTKDFAHIPLRWGLTGTIPKAPHEFVSLQACLGEVVNRLAASTLQDMEVLSKCHVNVVQMKEHVEYNNYQSELSYLTTDKSRMNYISELLEKISEDGNTLVLVDRIKSGEILAENLPGAKFVSGSMKSTDRKEAYDEINEANNSITIATYGVAAVGINIPRIFNMVLLEPGKSFVRVIQSIGRGVRKAEDKDFVQIWDITSTAKYSKKHLTERKKFYKEANYPFTIEKVNYR